MTGLELEQVISQFLSVVNDVPMMFAAAEEEQKELEDKTQDILHIVEMRPYALNDIDLVNILHEIRVQRRQVKQEQLVMTACNAWYKKNKNGSLSTLNNILGEIRKILHKQAVASYRVKTNVIEPKDTCIMYETKEIPGQLSLFEHI